MPDATQPAAFADEEPVDAEFVHHLVRGSELLQGGDAATARTLLERAIKLQPRSERGQNLLALTYFKLGLYDRADEVYRQLIAEHPQDATLRMNLGLVHLKVGRIDDAILSFHAALEIDPSHRKSQNYLGLTYLQRREYARAKEWFDRAGNQAMSTRATVAAANAPLGAVGEAGAALLEGAEVTFTPAEATLAPGKGPWVAVRAGAAPGLEAGPALEGVATEITTFTARQRIEGVHAAPFGITPSLVAIDVRQELYARVDGLVASFGAMTLVPAFKRFRGRVTDKPFGESSRRMMQVSGTGRLWVSTNERRFCALEIGEEQAYFREEALFAFEETLPFENGRVPSKYSGDLQLVHLRGRGKVLVVSRHRPRALDVVKDEPVRVPVEYLLGWHGNVAPRIVALAEETDADAVPVAAVELVGEGRVLLDAPL